MVKSPCVLLKHKLWRIRSPIFRWFLTDPKTPVPDQALFDPEGSWLLQGRSRSGNYLGVSEGSVHPPISGTFFKGKWMDKPSIFRLLPTFCQPSFLENGTIEQVEDELRLPGWVTIGSTIELTTITMHTYIYSQRNRKVKS